MYIYLEDDLCDLDFELDENLLILDFIFNLIYKSFKGKFILDGKKTLRHVLKSSSDKMLVSKIKFIIHRNMEYKEVFRSLKFKINISNNYKTVHKVENIINIPLHVFLDYDIGVVDFISEDYNDADYIDQAMRCYQILNKNLRNFSLKYNKINGGGANTPNVYDYHLGKKDNIVICLCDSDKYSPKGPLGTNAKECQKKNSSDSISYFFMTNGREIENDIPFILIKKTFSNDPNTLKKINSLPLYKYNICNMILKYSDLKKGVPLSWIEKLPKTSENEKYWKHCSRIIIENSWYNVENEKTIVIPNVAERLLKNVTLFLKNKSDEDLESLLNSYLESSNDEFIDFLSLGEQFFWIIFSFNEKKFVA
ncbi:hypothetical protein [Acinetobacter junii]|uniref:hypothetical protein n=1 Tax=Acinetobacter junii TaxID=40215 RepID=UPI00102E5FD6|nr:hypothetical protein [Acinetobacter junii]RZG70190.1 hypothetical protein EXE26_03735 [Acinetobacter junii]